MQAYIGTPGLHAEMAGQRGNVWVDGVRYRDGVECREERIASRLWDEGMK